MKKILLLALAVGGALAARRKVAQGRSGQALWAEATDSVRAR